MELSKESIVELYYNQKLPVKDIAKQFGVSTPTFNRHRKKLGIKDRPRNRYHDLSGKEFGQWKVVSVVPHKNHKVLWKCICKCGNTANISPTSLVRYKSTRCRKCGYLSPKFAQPVPNYYWNKVIIGAKKRSLKVTVSQEYCRKLFEKQKGKCALTGIDLYCGKSVREFKAGLNTASLDRINSSCGYTKNNIQWVHKVINNMKQELSQSDFKEWCRKVVEHE